MARSPSHKFGQIIGNLLEDIMLPFLDEFCREADDLYLDHRSKERPARRGRKKVSWQDKYKNVHDLDFVIEKGGTDYKLGYPIAFIECAWRRYTKHSRNKAQEIQGALLPLAETYWELRPFMGVILAGVFTDGAIQQLKSQGFEVLYIPYQYIVEAFKEQGINVEFDESTPDEEFAQVISRIEKNKNVLEQVKHYLTNKLSEEIDRFMRVLENRIARTVEKVIIVSLYGETTVFDNIHDALKFLDQHNQKPMSILPFRGYHIIVRFANGDRVEADFESKQRAKEFLAFVGSRG